jgi:hypothetical protein
MIEANEQAEDDVPQKLRPGEQLRELLTNVEAMEPLVRRIETFGRMRETARHRLHNDWLILQEVVGTTEKDINNGYWKLRDALDSFYLRDMLLYPMRQDDESAGELNAVQFARITPAEAKHYVGRLSARVKLAGEPLAHFGGFLDQRWRGNDLTWGRLDAAEVVINKLLPQDYPRQARRELIEQAHQEILDEMRKQDMRVAEEDAPDPPPASRLIGNENPADLPKARIMDYIYRSAYNLLTIVRATANTQDLAWLKRGLPGWTLLIPYLVVRAGLCVFWLRRMPRWAVSVRTSIKWTMGLIVLGLICVAAWYAWDHPLREGWNWIIDYWAGVFSESES